MRRALRHMGQLGLLAVLLAAIIPAHAQTAGAPAPRAVTYTGAGGITLAGTLVLPDHPAGARLPGVLIVPGGGATDRNGAGQLYSQIADALAQAGIASLRYDKRGVGASTAAPAPDDLAAGQAFRAWDNYVADAAAGFRYLQQQPELDPARTALLGHSEGAYLSAQVAAPGQGAAPPPAPPNDPVTLRVPCLPIAQTMGASRQYKSNPPPPGGWGVAFMALQLGRAR